MGRRHQSWCPSHCLTPYARLAQALPHGLWHCRWTPREILLLLLLLPGVVAEHGCVQGVWGAAMDMLQEVVAGCGHEWQVLPQTHD